MKKLFMLIMMFALLPIKANAHCDTMNGPVITDAKVALEKKDVKPVLKWIKKNDEKQVKDLFKKTIDMKAKGQEAYDLAQMYFFETLVRLHRAGEGAPYTGLKTSPVEPVVAEADKALEEGKADELVKHMSKEIENGIRKRFSRVVEKKKNMNKRVEDGREFVEAYVQYMHYVEDVYNATEKSGHEHHHEE